MAEHTLETRILLRYDTLSNWMNSTVILKQGEAAIAATSSSYTTEGTNNTPSEVGIKIGDGYHYFSELPWVQSVAGDVYAWAKSPTKPVYNASEIIGLVNYIEQHSSSSSSTGISASAYRIVYNSTTQKYTLQYQNSETGEWIDTTGEIDFSTINQRINQLENWASGSTSSAAIGSLDPLTLSIRDEFFIQLSKINYSDNEQQNEFVTSVSQSKGKINVTKAPLKASNITSGFMNVSQGGTGRDTLEQDAVLAGNGTGPVKLIPIADTIATDMSLVPNYLIKAYVDNAVAGLAGAMHYIGEATVFIGYNSNVNPRIAGYNFANAKNGDVIVSEHKEFVWTDGYWRLLGDEGSYAVKGSIMNNDIAEEAAISQSKIANLQETLSEKVNKIEGKQLSTNDFTDEEKQKLLNIEENAQRNIIEHIYINGTEAIPTIIEGNPNSLSLRVSALTPEEEEKIGGIENGAQVNKIEHIFLNNAELNIGTVKELPKSVNILLTEFTEEEKQKLSEIDNGAQINKIEKIFLNDALLEIDNKEVHLTINEDNLNLSFIKGAIVPNNNLYEEVDISYDKKLQLARISKTGNVKDLIQAANEYIVFDCGTSMI